MLAFTYSINSKISSISGDCSLHPQSKDAPCRGDRDPLNMDVRVQHIKTNWSLNYVEILTTWSWVLEMLDVALLIKKFSVFHGT
jgi:hypothetical protein